MKFIIIIIYISLGISFLMAATKLTYKELDWIEKLIACPIVVIFWPIFFMDGIFQLIFKGRR